ncbi:type I restriction-modification enzyme R subunit C-terminal domain-containing protein, partial [Streptomyces brasiliscabiei]
YNLPYAKRKLTYAAIKELAAKLADPPYYLMAADVWQAYRRVAASKVRGAPVDRMLTEIIALVRFTIGQADVLEPFGMQVEQRF